MHIPEIIIKIIINYIIYWYVKNFLFFFNL